MLEPSITLQVERNMIGMKECASTEEIFFFSFDFCRFCVVIRFFIPATPANDLIFLS